MGDGTRSGHPVRVAIIRPATAEDLMFLEEMLAVAPIGSATLLSVGDHQRPRGRPLHRRVAVVKPARRRGIGQQLLGALVEHAKGRGLPALSLSVAPDNHAVRLYKRVGFEEVGTVGESRTMLLRLPPRSVRESRRKVVESRLPAD